MTTTMIIILCLIAVNFIFNILFISLYHKYKIAYNKERYKLVTMEQEYSKLVECYKIQKKNKEEANEKINALRNGDVSADNILPKRKS